LLVRIAAKNLTQEKHKMITFEQKNANILARNDSKEIKAFTSRGVTVGGKTITVLCPVTETDDEFELSQKNRFGDKMESWA
jgi:hypothetical protein